MPLNKESKQNIPRWSLQYQFGISHKDTPVEIDIF